MPLKLHPVAIGVSAVCMPLRAGGAAGQSVNIGLHAADDLRVCLVHPRDAFIADAGREPFSRPAPQASAATTFRPWSTRCARRRASRSRAWAEQGADQGCRSLLPQSSVP